MPGETDVNPFSRILRKFDSLGCRRCGAAAVDTSSYCTTLQAIDPDYTRRRRALIPLFIIVRTLLQKPWKAVVNNRIVNVYPGEIPEPVGRIREMTVPTKTRDQKYMHTY